MKAFHRRRAEKGFISDTWASKPPDPPFWTWSAWDAFWLLDRRGRGETATGAPGRILVSEIMATAEAFGIPRSERRDFLLLVASMDDEAEDRKNEMRELRKTTKGKGRG